MKKVMLGIYRYFDSHHGFMWGILLVLLAVMSLCVFRISFVEDVGSFLPQKADNARINYAYEHVGAANKIMVNVGSATSDPDAIMDAVDMMAERLEERDGGKHIENIMYQISQDDIFDLMGFVVRNMPYYLTEKDYARIDTLLENAEMERVLGDDKKLLLSPAGGFMKQVIAIDPLHFSGEILSELGASNPTGENYELTDGYIFTKDGSEAMMTVTSKYPVSETSNNKLLIAEIEQTAREVEREFHGEIKIDFIGAAVISVENATRIKTDSIISTLLALILILALLLYFFRDARALVIILFSIIFGGVFGLAFLAIFKGTVSVIAIGVGSIIVGIAVNYPLHFLAHYQQGFSKEQTIKDIMEPLVTGNITTVGAFLSLIFISSNAMNDLGLFAAMLLIGTILFVLIFLPHVFRKKLFHNQNRQATRLVFGKIADKRFEQNRVVVVMIVLLTIPLCYFSRQTTFESDMNAINYMTPDQRTKLDKLIAETESGMPSMYCVSEAGDMEDALQLYEKSKPTIDSLVSDSLVVKRSGIGVFIPSKKLQKQRLALWNAFWKTRKDGFLKNLGDKARTLGFSSGAFSGFEEIMNADYGVREYDYFRPVLDAFADNYISNESGKCMVYTLMESENCKDVAKRLSAIDEDVYTFDNGSIISKMVNALSDDFDYVLYICGLIVFLFLTISFGRLELSIISFIPLAVGWIWILGIMNICDIKFNIVNIILATFIFGQGDDYTIFVTEGMMYEYTYRKKMLASYKNSILLSASIMFIGIGSLIIAKHPAMRSLAEVTIVGMFCVVLMAYIVPPLLYKWLVQKKNRYRLMPVTLVNLLKTVFAFFVFFIFSIILTIAGFFILTLGGKTKRHKRLYHRCVCGLLRCCARWMPGVRYTLHNETGENFDTPGVIICNHQSHLDLLYTLALNPNIICLTNKWVWRSPFYGWIIRYANYYPVTNGIEENEELLRKAVAEGYSILVFPEGTRSEDCSVLRFHKGAFYLAERLGVDIIPVVTHGIGHVFPKKEFLLRKGSVDVEILPRIKPGDPLRNPADYAETARNMRAFYVEEYDRMCRTFETPDYFADLVLHNYIYKGGDIERAARKNLKRNGNYNEFIATLPDEGTYEMENCGQGEAALLAALVKKKLQIVATDPNPELVEIARNCVSVPENLKFK